MNSRSKALGAALLAVLAIGAAMASAASAEGTDVKTDHFTSEVEKTVLTGEQVGGEADNGFGVKAVASLKVTCKKALYYGTTPANGVTTVTAIPTYFECSSNLGAATVTTDRCAFLLTGTTDEHLKLTEPNEGKKETHATVSLECSHETGNLGKITISTGGCNIIIESTHATNITVNQNLLGATYTNEPGPPKFIKVDATVDKIAYTTSGFACELAGLPKTGTDGFLTTTVTVKGFKDTGGVAKEWEEPKSDSTQVAIETS
jgi:hypothetical protein